MNIRKKFNLKLLWLLPLTALAAAPFLPDFVNTTTSAIQPVGYVGAPAANGYILNGSQSVYTINYSSADWSGNLNNYPISASGVISTKDNWVGGAAAVINAQNQDTSGNWIATGRNIVTMNGSAGVPFLWSNLSAAQKTALDPTTAAVTSASSSPVLNYIRGDGSNEAPSGKNYRARTVVLGDIIHSTPLYWDDGTNKTVFVGANDGMLHAINATTDATGGGERFAYIPSVLIPKLSALTAAPYVHKYFVDGQLAAANFGSQSILAGGLGGGGMGLFALDITATPTSESNAASKVLWEITNNTTGFSNLGHTYGTPVFTTLNGTKVLLVANGYNNGCTNACNNGVNSVGNGHASLFVIDAVKGTLIAEMDTGSGGTASPNGLSSPTLLGTNVYAGDINGTLWKFDLTNLNTKATPLYTTSPARPITMAPTLMKHPQGGYMVMFATGQNFSSTDNTDTSINYAYGIWDRPSTIVPSTPPTLMLAQTLTERNYTYTPSSPTGAAAVTVRVRTVTNNTIPDWTNYIGWSTALPIAGERVLGDGGFLSKTSAFTFLSTNPTINTSATIPGENWDNRLDALTGGRTDNVNFDLNLDSSRNTADQMLVSPSTTLESPACRYIGGGVRSPLVAFQTSTGKDIYQANYDKNGTVATTQSSTTVTGVAGGHFDVDNYYGSYNGSAQATATISVGTAGQTSSFPATLGNITVNGVVIVPALTVNDITDGAASTSNASVISNKINATGLYKATVSGNIVTVKAPSGAFYNSKTIDIADGTSQTLVNASAATPAVTAAPAVTAVTAVKPTGFITFSGVSAPYSFFYGTSQINDDLSNSQSILVGGNSAFSNTISLSSSSKTSSQVAAAVVAAVGTTGTYKAYVGGNGVTTLCAQQLTNVVCIVDESTTNYGGNNGKSISVGSISNNGTLSLTTTPTAGGVTGVTGSAAVTASPAVAAIPKSGWTNFTPALTTTAFKGGVDGTTTGNSCTNCQAILHVHQYDKKYDVTGVNFLNASVTTYNLANIISPSTNFKVLAQNQYLNPAAKIHMGNPGYLYNVDAGYTLIKDFVTMSTNPLLSSTTLPTYNLTNVGSLAVNLPVDALSSKDWWGNGDVRAGLIPTVYSCVYQSAGSNDGNMFQPITPPANGTDGPGVKGWRNSTTPATATGARHGGALTIQIIRAETPSTAIEQNVLGRPEYGWRVKSAFYAQYVLTEYNMYWHHPNGLCYGDTGWTKSPGADNGTTTLVAKAAGSTDPHIGSFGVPVAGTTVSVVTNANGSTTTTTIVTTINANGSATITTTVTNSTGGTTTSVTTDGVNTGGTVDSNGGLDKQGLEGDASMLGRVSWRELFK